MNQVGKKGKGKSKKLKGQSKCKGSSQSLGPQKGKGSSKSSKGKTKPKVSEPYGQVPHHLGLVIKIKRKRQRASSMFLLFS